MSKIRLLVFVLLLALVTAACGGTRSVSEAVDNNVVVRTVQYTDGFSDGPEYAVSVVVPDAWVGQFDTRTSQNTIGFTYVRERQVGSGTIRNQTPIFFIEALSESQYWEQIGSYPGIYTNVHYTADTYFVYYLAEGLLANNLGEATLNELLEAVPVVMTSFTVERTASERLPYDM